MRVLIALLVAVCVTACVPEDSGSRDGDDSDQATDTSRSDPVDDRLGDDGLDTPTADAPVDDPADDGPPADGSDGPPSDGDGDDSGSDPETDARSPDATSDACPAPPAGITGEAREAIDRVNAVRVPAGVGCATMYATVNTASRLHCEYYAANSGACTSDPHREVAGCEQFVAEQFWERMAAAGYAGSPAFEDMAFFNDGTRAVDIWVDSVWHRTPILSPWVRDLGYGGAPGCDTMDFGVGEANPMDQVAIYPYDGQTDVPTSFAGNEGPPPPAPPGGWPSGYPVHIYARQATITEHRLTVDGSDSPIEHVWLSQNDAESYASLISREHILYADAPLQPDTTYRVEITGSYVGGPLELDWTFTTR